MPRDQAELKQLPVEFLQRGVYQPRRDFDQSALEELSNSIRSQGLIQPIVVRPLQEGYEIIAGERRWRAAQLAGMDQVPCLIRKMSDEQAAAVTTIENIQREDLNPIEEAQSYQRLINEFSYQHDEVAAIVGVSRVKVSNTLRLLKLDDRIKDLLIKKKLSHGHGRSLAGLTVAAQLSLADKCIAEAWSVRRLEKECQRLQNKQQAAIQTGKDPDIVHLEQKVSEQFGAEVKLDPDADQKGGWMKIRYFDPDTLAGLLDKIGVDYE